MNNAAQWHQESSAMLDDIIASTERRLRLADRTSVQRAYLLESGTVRRVLLDSHGWFFDPDANDWRQPSNAQHVASMPGVYHTWSDVPFSWCNACPYFR